MRTTLARLRRNHTAAAAYLALFFALAGTAYAANYVTSQDILDETIQSADIAPGAVNTDELAAGSVTLDRLHADSVTGTKIANGTVWGVDVQNGSLTGMKIEDGTISGADLAVTTATAVTTSDPGNVKTVTATCPGGRKVLGGGGDIRGGDVPGSNPAQLITLARSSPADSGQGWTVRGEVIDHPGIPSFTLHYNDDGVVDGFASWVVEDNFSYTNRWSLKAWAICV